MDLRGTDSKPQTQSIFAIVHTVMTPLLSLLIFALVLLVLFSSLELHGLNFISQNIQCINSKDFNGNRAGTEGRGKRQVHLGITQSRMNAESQFLIYAFGTLSL